MTAATARGGLHTVCKWRAFVQSATAAGVVLLVLAPAARAESRGELLYATHCTACHTSEMHWRDQRVATDWPSLAAQVRRWQAAASLAWSERDILEVTRHLNETIYRFEQTSDARVSLRNFRSWLALGAPGPADRSAY